MQYVYILQSKKRGTLYTGCTTDLAARMKLHNAGKAHSTRTKIPFELLYYEAFGTRVMRFAESSILRRAGDAITPRKY